MPTVEHGVYMVTAADIYEGRIQLESARKTTEIAYRTLLTAKSKPKNNDILLTKDGSLGRLALVGNETICINQSVAVIRPNERVEPNFLKLLLESPHYQKRMLEDAGGSTIKHIYITIVNLMPVALPANRAEQRAIAAALSDVDALLGGLDRLITKKRDIKQAAMQQLLTGQTRLPGFSGAWEVKQLGEIATVQRGASPRPIDSPVWFDQNSSVGWVRISDVTCSGMYLKETTQQLSALGVKHSRPVAAGNLIMSICATVGRPVITNIDICIHDGFVVFDDLKAEQLFVYYVLKWIEPDWTRHGQTGSQMNLNTGLINGTAIKIPPRSEQSAIATVLSDMDAELAALEARRDKTRALKQAMMRELLTGKTRLVSPEVAHA
jgi:type I restriction enzyme S subunit